MRGNEKQWREERERREENEMREERYRREEGTDRRERGGKQEGDERENEEERRNGEREKMSESYSAHVTLQESKRQDLALCILPFCSNNDHCCLRPPQVS